MSRDQRFNVFILTGVAGLRRDFVILLHFFLDVDDSTGRRRLDDRLFTTACTISVTTSCSTTKYATCATTKHTNSTTNPVTPTAAARTSGRRIHPRRCPTHTVVLMKPSTIFYSSFFNVPLLVSCTSKTPNTSMTPSVFHLFCLIGFECDLKRAATPDTSSRMSSAVPGFLPSHNRGKT